MGIRPPSSCHQLSLAAQFSKASTAGPLRRPPGSQHSLQQLDDSLALHRQQLVPPPASLGAGRRPASLCRTPTVRSGVPPSIVTRSRSRSATAPRSCRSRAPWRFGRSRPTKVCGARRAENPHAAGPQRQSEQGRPEEATFCADSHRLGRGTVSPLGASTDSPLRPLLESNSSPPAPAPAASSPKRS